MEILKRVLTNSAIILPLLMVFSGILTKDYRFPLGVFIGGLTGIFNLRAIVRNVQSITGGQRITARYILLSIFRLIGIFALLFLLIWKDLVDLFGILTGFTVVFIIIIKEGLKEARSI